MNDAAALDPEGAALGLYVHVPFCEAKCTYCHFAIDPRRPDEARQERYLRAVLREMADAVPERPADTLYLGGGTPSLLTPERVARLMTSRPSGPVTRIDPLRRHEAALHSPFAAGIVELLEGRLRLAEAGVLVSNELLQAFV